LEADNRLLFVALLSYLAGGIPSGYLIARWMRGIDIREHGSGNPGAANVYRTVGPVAGWATLFFDALKGFLPLLLAKRMYPDALWVHISCATLAIVGHIWTVFLRFRGGKGVATSAGVFAALLPVPTLFAVVVFALATALTKHISLGSISGALILPVAAVLLHEPRPLAAMAALVSLLILLKHIPNMKRLLEGKELHFEKQEDGGSP
jgi:glycerol-3-phosphate acyltransferase PlsY